MVAEASSVGRTGSLWCMVVWTVPNDVGIPPTPTCMCMAACYEPHQGAPPPIRERIYKCPPSTPQPLNP